uniref:Jun dimerization protein 2 n=1 Tax=Castor canadensis TaxID=51338 RepID=A0A8B7UIQ9_CASCN|nr:jun dimerization protein 2 [Castor canadensis]
MTTLKDSVGAVITTTMIVGVISATRQNRVALPFRDTCCFPGCSPVLRILALAGYVTFPSQDNDLTAFEYSLSPLRSRRGREERRKRRREKNKVAAARCRNKKKERTEFLQRESERLELMNAELKTQIEELKQERQQLILMLNRHRPTCIVRTDSVRTPESEGNPLLEQLDKK